MSEQRMPREARERELRHIVQTQDGCDRLLSLIQKYEGLPSGTYPPMGTLLVATVLEHEYPAEKVTQ